MVDQSEDLKALIALDLVSYSKRMSDGYPSTVIRSDVEAAQLVLDSEWLRVKLRDAWDGGASRAGRYGHEDAWDDEMNPHNDNPYRTDEEKENGLW